MGLAHEESRASGSPRHRFCAGYASAFGAIVRLVRIPDLFLSVENTSTWRVHQAYAKKDGQKLKDLVVGRIASNMVFMSLLLSTTVGILFSPSDVCTTMRNNLKSPHPDSVINKIIGHFLLVSIFVTLFGIVSNFASWMIVASASKENSRAIISSTLGLFATYLPGVLVFFSINLVTVYMLLWIYVLIPDGDKATGIIYTVCVLVVYVFVVSTYSALGRLVLRTSAMGEKPIMDDSLLEMMDSIEVQEELMKILQEKIKRREARGTRVGARTQYLDSEKLPKDTGADEGNIDLNEDLNADTKA